MRHFKCSFCSSNLFTNEDDPKFVCPACGCDEWPQADGFFTEAEAEDIGTLLRALYDAIGEEPITDEQEEEEYQFWLRRQSAQF